MNIKVFNKWDVNDIKIDDKGLQGYICLEPKIVMRSGGRYAGNRFYKSKVFIVERLMNKLMVPGHKGKTHFKSSYNLTGKSQTAYGITENTFKVIEKKTGQNPVKIFVKAIENAATREEIITIEYGGARYPKAVECAPQRRIDLALKNMAQGAYHKSFNSKKSIVDTLADEIIAAYNLDSSSQAISKKLETERQADSSR